MIIPLNQPRIRQIRPEVIIYDGDNSFDASRYVKGINTDVSLDSPVGTMRVSFVPVNNENLALSTSAVMNLLQSKIRKYCRISVKIDRSEPEHTFYGIIDQTFESKTTNNGQTGRTWTCNCSKALPKLLIRDEIPNTPILQSDKKVISELGEVRAMFLGLLRGMDEEGRHSIWLDKNPEIPIRYILENAPSTIYFNKYINLKGDDPESLFNKTDIYDNRIIDLNFLKTDAIFNTSLTTYSGTVLGYIIACMDPDYYEIFFETTTLKDGNPANKMTIRPRPYSFKELDNAERVSDGWTYWEDLDAIEFHSRYRTQEQLGTNDFEIANFFETTYERSLVASPEAGGMLIGCQYPVMDFDLIKRYGIRSHRSAVKYLNTVEMRKKNMKYKEEGSDNFFKSLMTKRDKMADWFLYPDYESGQITALGNSTYKIGRKLYYTDRMYYDTEKIFQNEKPTIGMEYYISRVAHTFEYPGTYLTTLGLTRGQPVKVVQEAGAYYKSMVPDWLKKRNLYKVNRIKEE
ncbi:MAG TPA: hypothetical protein VHO03_16990 [Ignavibacteriales bacterium]|nr:hypothetical protein [Ignavibacteriales bacterium]